MTDIYVVNILLILIGIILCYIFSKLIYIDYYNSNNSNKFIFNSRTFEFEEIARKTFFNTVMKKNDIVIWKFPMNEAEENDKMQIIGFYGETRVLVKHLNEHNNISTERISDLQSI